MSLKDPNRMNPQRPKRVGAEHLDFVTELGLRVACMRYMTTNIH
jgi:hypothetical protein